VIPVSSNQNVVGQIVNNNNDNSEENLGVLKKYATCVIRHQAALISDRHLRWHTIKA